MKERSSALQKQLSDLQHKDHWTPADRRHRSKIVFEIEQIKKQNAPVVEYVNPKSLSQADTLENNLAIIRDVFSRPADEQEAAARRYRNGL